jgi:hypothetical protein
VITHGKPSCWQYMLYYILENKDYVPSSSSILLIHYLAFMEFYSPKRGASKRYVDGQTTLDAKVFINKSNLLENKKINQLNMSRLSNSRD